MSGPPCSICSSVRRAEIDDDLINGMSTTRCAEKWGGSQTTYSRHKRLHLKPHLQAIAQAAMPSLPSNSPALAVAMIPTVGAMLAKFGTTIEKLETLVDDAERDGGIAVRAVSLRELRSGLTDATKLIATLAPQPAPPTAAINHCALLDVLHAVAGEDREELLDRLLP
jgi:hypothetical protein